MMANFSIAKFESTLQPWQDDIMGFSLTFITLIAIVSNGLSVIVFTGRPDNATDIFLLNIATANLLLAILSHPAVIVSIFAHRWLFEPLGCTVHAMFCYFLRLATTMTLMTVAVVRYLKACQFQIGKLITKRKAHSILLLVYVYSFLWAVLPLFGLGAFDTEPFGTSCNLQWDKFDQAGEIHIMLVCIFWVFLPAIVTSLCHLAIFLRVRKAESGLGRTAKQTSRALRRLLHISLAVCLGFLIAWLPFALLSLWFAYGDSSSLPTWITPIPALVAMASITYNPILYVILTEHYRAEVKQAICKLLQFRWPFKLRSLEEQNIFNI